MDDNITLALQNVPRVWADGPVPSIDPEATEAPDITQYLSANGLEAYYASLDNHSAARSALFVEPLATSPTADIT